MSTTPGSGFDPLQQNITILDRTQTPFNETKPYSFLM
ncbi:hypothetical protein M7I_0393 [Glarea lozoyensis 74030]|uniref:Uncharacterized protein n=1 Tax=Glarea lozoyensis (strain ATCC 74030 / MF5533) TaxID=1104152 RepID=H0ED89_GLAL7|nr:hypothetical protein M7I_0393 [Glarea lozoyensis 74030]